MLRSQLFRMSAAETVDTNDAIKEAILKSGLLEVMKTKKEEEKAKKS